MIGRSRIQDRPEPRCTVTLALLVQPGFRVPAAVEVADVDEEVEEFHYGNAATARRRICILEGRQSGPPGGQAGHPSIPDRQR